MHHITDIETIIDEHFDYIQRDYHILPEDEFDRCYHDYPQARYGWTFPEIGAFCVDRIRKQTVSLGDEDLSDYMRAILWMIDRHVVLGYEDPDLTPLARHRLIESELYDTAPASLALISQIEISALDG